MTDPRSYGTFRDCLTAPIHRWFTYPAGYSYRLIEAKVDEHGLDADCVIGDPFVGTGTTSIAAKMLGIGSVGVEAHPFVHWVADTKLAYDLHDVELLRKEAATILDNARDAVTPGGHEAAGWPPLIGKCFDLGNLDKLHSLRQAVLAASEERHNFFKLALTSTLRDVTTAGAGWPYIAPSKYAARKVSRDAFIEFERRCTLMADDVDDSQRLAVRPSRHKVILGDARRFASYADDDLDMVITSPPYLNNYDYADRTRLETYFWGMYNSWSDITVNVRDKLMTAATTQVRRTAMEPVASMPLVRSIAGQVHAELSDAVGSLAAVRKSRRGAKSYDLMVAGYFEDIAKVIAEVGRSIQSGCPFILVLGDSAPYGVHVPTDEMIGRLAVASGFDSCSIEVIRKRGGKWASNSQRHNVALRESIVTLIR